MRYGSSENDRNLSTRPGSSERLLDRKRRAPRRPYKRRLTSTAPLKAEYLARLWSVSTAFDSTAPGVRLKSVCAASSGRKTPPNATLIRYETARAIPPPRRPTRKPLLVEFIQLNTRTESTASKSKI